MAYEAPAFDPTKLSKDERIQLLEAKVAFLLDEVSSLRTLMRHVSADKLAELQTAEQTRDSFNYQWRSLPQGHAMLSNPEWKATAAAQILEYTQRPREWFCGKRVLDAGCGQGRWTYGLASLGVERCVSVDISPAAIERTTEVAREFGDRVQVVRRSLLQDLELSNDFDLVWCFGVLHHTGDTYQAFQNVVRCVTPGGYLFLMIYAEPRRDQPDGYLYYHEMFDMRSRLKNLPFDEKVARVERKYGKELLHGYFDAISPEINDLYRWDELESWVLAAGFEDVKRTMDIPNHCLVARRKR
jgi:SAM-dependent methyltransferase